MTREEWLRTSIGHATEDEIVLRGRSLAGDLMGKMSFADLAFFLTAGREPSEGESSMFNALLVSLADHGLTPTALATRLTYTGAPESVQGSIAAGLLGAGSVFLGPVEDTARFLAAALEGNGDEEDELRGAAERAVAEARAGGRRVPGLGHPIHKQADPRTARIYELAEETGTLGPHLRLLRHVAEAQAGSGKRLPINGAGAAGAALADLGFEPLVARGFAVLARTAGLVAHVAEESVEPLGMKLWREVDERASGDSRRDEP
jgi:citrate synthase